MIVQGDKVRWVDFDNDGNEIKFNGIALQTEAHGLVLTAVDRAPEHKKYHFDVLQVVAIKAGALTVEPPVYTKPIL